MSNENEKMSIGIVARVLEILPFHFIIFLSETNAREIVVFLVIKNAPFIHLSMLIVFCRSILQGSNYKNCADFEEFSMKAIFYGIQLYQKVLWFIKRNFTNKKKTVGIGIFSIFPQTVSNFKTLNIKF